jgi:arylsulfatase
VYFKENFAVRSEARLVEDDRVLPVPDDFYATEAFTDRAVAFLDAAARRKAPFFLYLAHIAPHFPLQARPEEIDRHRARYQAGWDEVRAARWKRLSSTALLATTLPPRDPEALPWNEESPSARADQALRMAIYAAQVEALDRSVDRVVARLQAIGRLENTLIMFLSDNGGCGEGGRHGFDRSGGEAVGTRRSYHSIGSSWANVSNTPFRRFKHYIHEGGIATPFIVHWPARIDPNAHGGAIRHDVGHVMDVLPTILEATGMRAPRTRNGKKALTVDGISLLASFTGAGKPRPAPLFWEHEGNRGVRDGDWKLVAVHGGPWELYDLRKDRTELTNVAAQNRDVVDRLGAAYQEWARLNEVVPWSRLEAAAAASSPSRGARAAEGEESRP